MLTIPHGIIAIYWLNGIFFFSCTFNKEPIQWCLLLPPFEDFAEMWHCIVLKQIHLSHCYSLIQVVLFYKILHCFPHFTHLPILIWTEGFLCLFLLLCRWDADIDFLWNLAVLATCIPCPYFLMTSFLTSNVIISFLLPFFSPFSCMGAIVYTFTDVDYSTVLINSCHILYLM